MEDDFASVDARKSCTFDCEDYVNAATGAPICNCLGIAATFQHVFMIDNHCPRLRDVLQLPRDAQEKLRREILNQCSNKGCTCKIPVLSKFTV